MLTNWSEADKRLLADLNSRPAWAALLKTLHASLDSIPSYKEGNVAKPHGDPIEKWISASFRRRGQLDVLHELGLTED